MYQKGYPIFKVHIRSTYVFYAHTLCLRTPNRVGSLQPPIFKAGSHRTLSCRLVDLATILGDGAYCNLQLPQSLKLGYPLDLYECDYSIGVTTVLTRLELRGCIFNWSYGGTYLIGIIEILKDYPEDPVGIEKSYRVLKNLKDSKRCRRY